MAFLVAILLITVGLIGLLVRYADHAGQTAKMALGTGVLGGVAGVVSNILMISGYEYGRSLMNSSMAVILSYNMKDQQFDLATMTVILF
jgi:hypothetical protein